VARVILASPYAAQLVVNRTRSLFGLR